MGFVKKYSNLSGLILPDLRKKILVDGKRAKSSDFCKLFCMRRLYLMTCWFNRRDFLICVK